MAVNNIGIVMNGVTGRMGANQHLIRSLCAIRDEGGLTVGGTTIVPVPMLVGRNPEKLHSLSVSAGGVKWSTDLDTALSAPENSIYFDAQVTDRRTEAVSRAIDAGKHVYCEKPTATSSAAAYKLYSLAKSAGVCHGVVQDKLWLPGLIKLRNLVDTGYFGRILSIRGEFGYWVFTGGETSEGGDAGTPQRPSWNYRAEDGGGIILDMLCHWRYVLDNVFGKVRAVSCLGANHISNRWDESGNRYAATADDAAYATFELDNGAIAQFNSSWCVRVKRDDLLTLQVDGTNGSAVAGLRDCYIQPQASTPRPIWNPDVPGNIDYQTQWQRVPDVGTYKNAFRAQWELFLTHVVTGAPFPWDLLEGARGVQLAEAGMQSWKTRSWVTIPPMTGEDA